MCCEEDSKEEARCFAVLVHFLVLFTTAGVLVALRADPYRPDITALLAAEEVKVPPHPAADVSEVAAERTQPKVEETQLEADGAAVDPPRVAAEASIGSEVALVVSSSVALRNATDAEALRREASLRKKEAASVMDSKFASFDPNAETSKAPSAASPPAPAPANPSPVAPTPQPTPVPADTSPPKGLSGLQKVSRHPQLLISKLRSRRRRDRDRDRDRGRIKPVDLDDPRFPPWRPGNRRAAALFSFLIGMVLWSYAMAYTTLPGGVAEWAEDRPDCFDGPPEEAGGGDLEGGEWKGGGLEGSGGDELGSVLVELLGGEGQNTSLGSGEGGDGATDAAKQGSKASTPVCSGGESGGGGANNQPTRRANVSGAKPGAPDVDPQQLLPPPPAPSSGSAALSVSAPADPHFCRICARRKPARVYHCRACNRCILRMDHHCPWIGGCVGARNHKFFFLFTVYTASACAFALVVFARFLYHNTLTRNHLPAAYSTAAFFTVPFGIMIALCAILGTGTLASWNVFLISKNLTTVEYYKRHRMLNARAVASPGSAALEHPYDRGWFRNAQQVMGKNPLMWLVPVASRARKARH